MDGERQDNTNISDKRSEWEHTMKEDAEYYGIACGDAECGPMLVTPTDTV